MPHPDAFTVHSPPCLLWRGTEGEEEEEEEEEEVDEEEEEEDH